MKSKSEMRSMLISFMSYVHNQFNKSIKIIMIDNAHEFYWKKIYDKHGCAKH